jgi:hypothetical protein
LAGAAALVSTFAGAAALAGALLAFGQQQPTATNITATIETTSKPTFINNSFRIVSAKSIGGEDRSGHSWDQAQP